MAGMLERERRQERDPGGISPREYPGIVKSAVTKGLADGITDVAAALAYYSFLAIPAALLLVLGVFGLVVDPQRIESLMERLSGVVPPEAITLLQDSLERVSENRGGGWTMIVVGSVLALWTSSGAMTAFMRGLNVAYEQDETRGFVKQRLVALAMLGCMVAAFLLVFGLLVLGPVVSDWLGGALDMERAIGWVWWTAQWPILVGALLLIFAIVLTLGPNLGGRDWRAVGVGAAFAVVVWLAASGLFALYVGSFGSYNKTWGSLAAVVIMLTWLWLSGLALLLGAEINAELRRLGTARDRG
ncbi:MAG TPA: YihY/virulence factor BrkB family protein [Gaiellaceae bacterium]|nr:YihY/virulence factor BrkB family protein [Gaiellaceae bacterium]